MKLYEYHALAGTAWAIRREEATRLNVPVNLISWKASSLRAKAKSLRAEADEAERLAAQVPAFGYGVTLTPAPRRFITPAIMGAVMIVELALIILV